MRSLKAGDEHEEEGHNLHFWGVCINLRDSIFPGEVQPRTRTPHRRTTRNTRVLPKVAPSRHRRVPLPRRQRRSLLQSPEARRESRQPEPEKSPYPHTGPRPQIPWVSTQARKAVGIFGKLHQGLPTSQVTSPIRMRDSNDDEGQKPLFLLFQIETWGRHGSFCGTCMLVGDMAPPASAFTSRATLAACLWGFSSGVGDRQLKRRTALNRSPSMTRFSFPFLQRHEGFGDVQPQTAALGVPGASPGRNAP